jgi:ribosomal protein L6P/L9E
MFVASKLGMLKFKIPSDVLVYTVKNVLIVRNNNYFSSKKNNKSVRYVYYFIKKLFNLIKNLTIGHTIKYKVVGLGHKALYSNNNYLFKLGYSHMVYCFIPILFMGRKKKKKKMFHKITSIENVNLNNFFFYIKHLRVPDIFSMNGVFNRTFYMEFKKGKKSFLL